MPVLANVQAVQISKEDPGSRWASEWQAAATDKERDLVFRRISEAYSPRLRAFFNARGTGPEESRDLLQDCMVRVHHGLATFAWKSRFDTWLFTIATNVLHNHRRGRKTLKRCAAEVSLEHLLEGGNGAIPESALAAGASDGPLDGILAVERSRLLRSALDDLPPQMRRCVLLRVQDYRYREIAEVLRVSIDTVKAHLYQARQHLKVKLGAYFQVDL